MAGSGIKAVETGFGVNGKTCAAQKTPVSIKLTDGYQIPDATPINKKILFDGLLKPITVGSHAYGKPNKYGDINL
jgi:hypothetical protein